ncbi:glycosyltransferase [Bacillus wiedmannii]|uniref:glycosyltransferase n=1 Tax=Bacillus wiedmannii TaxID=1890302 RepID=UPI000BFA9BFC|nr:glycosyltransferase [Bacillus wiedmannii]PEU30044.1 hypothetical protein CN532_07865 [Bacillus wiedmannii]
MTLKVIFANRKDCFDRMGGDTVQMMKTKEHLEKQYDIEVIYCTSPQEIEKHKDVSIVHIFNIQTIEQTLEYIEICKKNGKKVALSTIYWDLSHAYYIDLLSKLKVFNMDNLSKYKNVCNKVRMNVSKVIGKTKTYGTDTYKELRRKALIDADILLPNSAEELGIVANEFGIPKEILEKKAFLVPNAIENKEKVDIRNSSSINVEGYILQVGRIEPIKNQLNVVKAMFEDKEIPIVFIGRIGNEAYYKEVIKLAEKRGNVFFLGELSHDDLIDYYQKAKVHILPSFRESPGLSTLEALWCGTEIVVATPEYCPVHFYKFDKYGHQCDPYDVKSIRESILTAMENPKNVELPDAYKHYISYENAANITYSSYQSILI